MSSGFEGTKGLVAEAFNVLHETGLTPRQLTEECQIHRGAHLVIDQIVMGAGVFEVEVEGGLEPAWENTAAAVRKLTEERAELLEALRWYVDNDDTNIGQEGNEFWELGLDRARTAIANATRQCKEPGA